jgi:GT2 family glycosyltransferase
MPKSQTDPMIRNDLHVYGNFPTEDTQVELAVIILNWNAAADTVRCVQHIAAWKRLRPTIWVVDNASHDDSVQVIFRECPHVRLICNATNLGFAGGNNRGIVEALAAGDAPIMLLNNDAHIDEENVARLLETLQADEQIGFIGPLLFDEEERLLSAGGKSPLHHHSHIYELPAGEPVYTVEYVPGTVMIGRAEVFRTVGLLDEDYFFSTEVADLCMRAGRRGYVSVIDARARASHTLDRSSNLRRTLHTYYIVRNRFLVIRKLYPERQASLRGFWALYSLALCFKVLLSGQSATARAIWLGLLDGLRGRCGGQNERVLQRLRRSTSP